MPEKYHLTGHLTIQLVACMTLLKMVVQKQVTLLYEQFYMVYAICH